MKKYRDKTNNVCSVRKWQQVFENLWTLLFLTVFGLIGGLVAPLASASQESLLEGCYLPGYSQPAECGFVEVPRKYQQPDEGRVRIHVSRVRSRSGETLPPLFVLAGGPGQAATELGRFIPTAFAAIIKRRDIIFVDQRGTGKSLPISCETASLATLQQTTRALQSCRQKINPLLGQLTTRVYVEDLESVRQYLGLDNITLWGGSYGTFSAQAYASAYPDAVDGMILDAVVSLDSQFLAEGAVYAQQALQRLVELCQENTGCQHAYPDWPQQLSAIINRLNETPLSHGQLQGVTGLDLAQFIRTALYSPISASRIPMAVERAYNGDYSMIQGLAMMAGSGASNSMYLGLTLGVLCQEHISEQGQEYAIAKGQKSFVKHSYFSFWQQACGTQDASLYQPFEAPEAIEVPTLLLSGELDPVTPEQSAEQARKYLPNSTHLIIANSGHIVSYQGCVPNLIAEFLEQKSIAKPECAIRQGSLPFTL
ncbi:alpha/beta hydrolase [Thalassotalea litorea]|uniref:Proline iminopeptidase n=1 Tax=Thalassotalea litorea TaxID=2020715 RepID=A0A5R9IMI5_9GAMM|nr:alpha/beta fold hydrolase [Thalassotalea litorea]TLU65799.1 alpha/beta hydrolase [Thalassotalea litorea]